MPCAARPCRMCCARQASEVTGKDASAAQRETPPAPYWAGLHPAADRMPALDHTSASSSASVWSSVAILSDGHCLEARAFSCAEDAAIASIILEQALRRD